MQPSPELIRLCNLRAEFSSLTFDDQAALLRNCFEVIGPVYRELAIKHSRLVEWIGAE